MKKTVLFLMNGFGIEQLNSYNIYNAKLMPNLDFYTKNYLFTSIESKAHDLISGYRTFSTGSDLPLTYSLIDNYVDNFSNNKNFDFYLNSIKPENKIHLFLSLESDKCYEHLKAFIKFIRAKKNNPIYVHLILTANNTNNYKIIEKIINKISYDMKECKIGMIVGLNMLNSINLTSFMNLYKNEIGEKWREVTKKVSSLVNTKTKPFNVKEFYMNEGFKINNDDSLFFFNYEYCDLTNFINNVSKEFSVNFYSMFGINGIKYTMFAYPKSGISMLNSLNKIDAKALILTNKDSVKFLNYYCCGLENILSERIFFTKTDNGLNPNLLKSIIKDSDYDLIIINYQVDNVEKVDELKDKLSKLDSILKVIHDFCVEKEISLFISSLYGMQKELAVDNFVKAVVDFSGKVPFIVVDPIFNKSNFMVTQGNIFNLADTIYTNINNKYTGIVLIRKKGYITKLLKK